MSKKESRKESRRALVQISRALPDGFKQTDGLEKENKKKREEKEEEDATTGSEKPVTLDNKRKTKWLEAPCLCSVAAGCYICWCPPSE